MRHSPQKTRLFINGRFLLQRVTGVQRFALEIVKLFDIWVAEERPLARDLDLTILAPDRGDVMFRPRALRIERIGRRSGFYWDQIELAVKARKGVLLSLCGTGPVVHPQHVVAIHDTAVYANPANFTPLFRSAYRTIQPRLARRATRLITVSEFSRGEIVRYLRCSERKITVLGNSVEHILDVPSAPIDATKNGLSAGRYVLAMGSTRPNKNLLTVIKAMKHLTDLGLKLAVVGSQDRSVFRDTENLPADGFVHLGHVDDVQLRGLYESALCFVFPSLYEGFGIPPLEAMALGCPVIVSSTSALPETCGAAALYVEPLDATSLAQQIRTIHDDTAVRKRLIRAGHDRVRRYRWEDTASSILEIATDVALGGNGFRSGRLPRP